MTTEQIIDLEDKLKDAVNALRYNNAMQVSDNVDIADRLDSIEKIVLAHQSWTVLQRGDTNCHVNVRDLVASIHNIIGTKSKV